LESLLSPIFALVAILYAAVGQAGGTGYIAVMGLIGFAPNVIKPTALALNILVAAIGCARFYRAGLLSWRSCYPFAVLGAPFSLLGGAVHLWGSPAAGSVPNDSFSALRGASRRKRATSAAVHGVHAGRRACRLCLWHHRSRRRDIPRPAGPITWLGGNATGVCGFRSIQSAQLNSRACWGLGDNACIARAVAMVARIRWIWCRHRFVARSVSFAAEDTADHLSGASGGFWPAYDRGVIARWERPGDAP